MSGRYRVLDLYCGAGGASAGLRRAFPEALIVGVDNRAQPRYPFHFTRGDALDYAWRYAREFDFIWASPPCQAFTPLRAVDKKHYPDLIAATRAALRATGRPYVIENVPQAPLENPIRLCGGMFTGLRVYRHRHFESNRPLQEPAHPEHRVLATGTQRGRKAHYASGGFITITGDVGTYCGGAMQIDWMNGNELSQAIPPAYAEYIARAVIEDTSS